MKTKIFFKSHFHTFSDTKTLKIYHYNNNSQPQQERETIAHTVKLPREFYLLTATAITLFLASQTTQPILPLYITEKGANTFELGIIISLLSFTAIAAKIPLIGLAPFLLIRRKTSHTPSPRKADPSLLTSLKAIISSRNMLILSYLRLTFSFTYAFFITLFALHAKEIFFPLPESVIDSLIALLFGIKGATNMLSRFLSGKLADKIGYKIPIVLAFTLLTITFLTISTTDNIYFLAFAMIIYGAAHGIRAVTEWSMLGEYAPTEAATVATAYLSTMFNVGAALGAVAAGVLSTILNTQTIFKLASIITLTGAFAVTLTKTKNTKLE